MLTLTVDAHDPARLTRFWGTLLDRPADGTRLPPTDTQTGLHFVPGDPRPPGRDRLHLHVTGDGDDGQRRVVAAALQLGATHLDVGQRPEEGHVVLADPEGYEFCVIEPGNAYLAGCGPLAELACDGGREVGLFWSAALGWPLVWDQDQETAIQSPYGGTKIAWGGPSETPRTAVRDRQRFHLPVAGDPEAEARRLVGLGATRLAGDGVPVLADPGGSEFTIDQVDN